MATREIKTKIALEGETEFKQKITEINKGITVLNSEMTKCTATYGKNADSVEALTEKGDILERTLLSQKDKVETLRTQLQRAAEAYGEADKRTMDLQISLNNAEAAVAKTENAIEANNEALDEARENTDGASKSFNLFANESQGLGDMLSGVAEKLGVNIPNGATNALNSLGNVNGAMVGIVGIGATVIAGIVKAEQALADLAKTSAAYVDDIVTLSTQTGIAVDTLQEWSYASELIDVELETMTGSMAKMIRNMNTAREGTGDAADAWSTLGIQIVDANGQLRDSETVFFETIAALGQMTNETERDAAAMAIFGKSAQDLNPLITAGREEIEALGEEARETGYVLQEWQINVLNDYQDALDRATASDTALANQMSSVMAPGLQLLTEGWQNLKYEGVDLLLDSGIIQFLSDLAGAVGIVINFIGDMLETVNALLHPIRTLREIFGIETETLEEHAARLNENTTAETELTATTEGLTTSVESYTDGQKTATTATNEATTAIDGLSSSQNIATATTYEAVAAILAQGDAARKTVGDLSSLQSQAQQLNSLMSQHGLTSYYDVVNTLGQDWGDVYKRTAYTDDWQTDSSIAGVKSYTEAERQAARRKGISLNASGNDNFQGGWTMFGENGTEAAYLPSGTKILSAQETARQSGNTYVINADINNIETFTAMMQWFEARNVRERMNG